MMKRWPAPSCASTWRSSPDVEIVGQAANGFEAVKLAEELNPELVFLDIQMPKLSGFEVLELLGERAPAVIFTTAYDEFALRAFEVHAVDYLLKPVEPPRLAAAVERAAERLRNKTPAPSAHELSVSARPPGRTLERILIRHEGRVHVLPLERIDFIEAQDDYLSFSCRRQAAAQAADDGDLETPARSDALRAHPSLVHSERRAAGAHRPVRQGQLARHPLATAPSCRCRAPGTRS